MDTALPSSSSYTMAVASIAAILGYLTAYIYHKGGKGKTLFVDNAPSTDLLLREHSDDDGGYKMVILVRNDINMSRGKAAAQCCHATLAAYKSALKKHPLIVTAWEQEGQPKVTLKTDSQQQLEELQAKARQAGLTAEAIRDAGRTQLIAGTKTVCAIGPGPARLVNLITGHLKLY